MTKAKPVRVQAMGAHLTDEVQVYNYGVLQVAFDDGSVGWYEAGWGPMMSETAFFVKDVIGPKGSVSIVMAENSGGVKSDDINAHVKTNQILWHHTDMSKPDERIDMTDEPGHDDLCEREQRISRRGDRRGHRPRRPHGRRGEEPAHRDRRRRVGEDPSGCEPVRWEETRRRTAAEG